MTDINDLIDYPNNNYKKFFAKFEEINTLPIESWNSNHILAYFCKKYKEQYLINYKFKFNSPAPSKSFEVFQVKRLAMLLSSKPNILKDYIDWVFANKVVKAKRRLTSISFLTIEDTLSFYKVNILLSTNSIQRTTPLPDSYKNIFTAFNVQTYGDLAFLAQMQTDDVNILFNKIKELGFDSSILSKIL